MGECRWVGIFLWRGAWVQVCGVDYIQKMYKQSLKRSKIEQRDLYTRSARPPHSHHHALSLAPPDASLQSFDVEDRIVFPISFYNAPQAQPDAPLFTPLNFEWHEYPGDLKQEIGCVGDAGIRAVGSYKGIAWCWLEGVLQVWERNERKIYRYKLHTQTSCVQIGEIESSSLHFRSRNLYLVGVGVGNAFHLFGIDKATFAMVDLNFTLELINSRTIQRISFVRQNQILIASDTCMVAHLDFTDEARIALPRPPLLQRALPFLPLLYPSADILVEQLLISGDCIYALVREERPVGWLRQQAKAALNTLMMRRQPIVDVVQRRWIELHVLNRVTNTVQFKQKITDQEFVQKLKVKHPQACENTRDDGLKLASIYLSSEGVLSVVTRCGFFISVNQFEGGVLSSRLVRAQRESSIGAVGFFLEKRGGEEEQSKENEVVVSLGLGGLTFMNNALWFISEQAVESVKCDQMEGNQVLGLRNGLQDEWVVFTRAGYYRVSRLKLYEVFIGYLIARNELSLTSPEKAWADEANFDLFVENLGKSVGFERICESLIDCLLRQQTQVSLSQQLLQHITDELRGLPSKNFRDWTYALTANAPATSLKLTEKVGAEVWRRLLDMQSKSPKRECERLVGLGIHCNAYWYALRSLFVKYSWPLMRVEAKTIKARMDRVEDGIRLLETLPKFFFLKGEKELRLMTESLANRSSVLKKERDAMEATGRPKMPERKEKEEATEATVDQTTIAQQKAKYVNESALKLQSIVINSIKKLKTLVTVFLYLADLNEAEKLGSILQVFSSRSERATVRRHLLGRVQDVSRLQEFSCALPELELGRSLEFKKWVSFQQKYKMPEMANLEEISKFISSEELGQLRSIFEGRADSLTDLLLLYWDRLARELNLLAKRDQLTGNKPEVLENERMTAEGERKELLCAEMKAVEGEVQTIITAAIKAYINSSQEQYPRAEETINDIIRIVCSHDDNALLAFAENEMSNFGLAEKVFLIRRLKKKTETAPSAQELLGRRTLAEARPVVPREYKSNFEIYIQEAKE